jgi:hypothetical protein
MVRFEHKIDGEGCVIQADTHLASLPEVRDYVAAAIRCGLTDTEISLDLMDRFSGLWSTITVESLRDSADLIIKMNLRP